MSLLQEYKAHEAQRQSEGGLPGLAQLLKLQI